MKNFCKVSMFATLMLLLFYPFFEIFAFSQKEAPFKVLIRAGDGGHHKARHLRKIDSYLSSNGCLVEVASIAKDSPTPTGTDIEFSPEPIDVTKERLAGFRLLAQARTIEGKTKVGGAVLVLAATAIENLKALDSERIAFVSQKSASGYLLPLQLLAEAGVVPSEEHKIFVGNHVGAVSMLLHGDAFAAAAAAPLARDWLTVNNELAIVALTPLVETGGWWINEKISAEKAMVCAAKIGELAGSRLKAFPEWVGGFNPK